MDATDEALTPWSSAEPELDYPTGGPSTAAGGPGIFTDASTGEALNIWVDTRLVRRKELLGLLTGEGAEIATFHGDEDVSLIILDPASQFIFDAYCHPDWLKTVTRRQLAKRRKESGVEDERPAWTHKVMLKRGWAEKCVQLGRFLGQADSWGGFRAGGPPQDDGSSDEEVPIKTGKAVKAARQADPIFVDVDLESEGEAQADDRPEEPVQDPFDSDAEPRAGDVSDMNLDMPFNGDAMQDIDIDMDDVKVPTTYNTFDGTDDDVEIPEESNTWDALPSHLAAGLQDAESDGSEDDDDEEQGESDEPGSEQEDGGPDHADSVEEDDEQVDSALALSTDPPAPISTTASANGKAVQAPILSKNAAAGPSGSSTPRSRQASPNPRRIATPPPPPRAPSPTPIDPKTMFDGIRFYVDVDKSDRRDYLALIMSHKGTVVPQMDLATHCLINYYEAKKARWDPMIRAHSKKGTWFLMFEWVRECVEKGRLVGKKEWLIPGGRPLHPKAITRATDPAASSGPGPTRPAGPAARKSTTAVPAVAVKPESPTEEELAAYEAPSRDDDRVDPSKFPLEVRDRSGIDQQFYRRWHLVEKGEWSREKLCERMAKKYPMRGKLAWWLETGREWETGTGMFLGYKYPVPTREQAALMIRRRAEEEGSTPPPTTRAATAAATVATAAAGLPERPSAGTLASAAAAKQAKKAEKCPANGAPQPARPQLANAAAGPSRMTFGPPPTQTPSAASKAPAKPAQPGPPAPAPATTPALTPASATTSQSAASVSKPQKGYAPGKTVEELDVIFKKYKSLLALGELSKADMYRDLVDKYETYTERTWANYHRAWASRTGRFEDLPLDGAGAAKRSVASGGALSTSTPTATAGRKDSSATSTLPASKAPTTIAKAATAAPTSANNVQNQEKPRIGLKLLARTFERDYLPLYKRGMSWSEIGQKISSELEENDPARMTAMFKQWYKKTGDFAFLAIPSSSTQPPFASGPGSGSAPASPIRPQLSRGESSTDRSSPKKGLLPSEIAAIFKQYEGDLHAGTAMTKIGDKIYTKHPELAAGTWGVYMGSWRKGTGIFVNLPEHLRYAGASGAGRTDGNEAEAENKPDLPATPVIARTTPAPKRAAPSEISSASGSGGGLSGGPKRQRRHEYSPEEETAMAAYIFGRLPEMTAFRVPDWLPFHRDHPSRSAAAYTEHYRGFAPRIDALVMSMGGVVRGVAAVAAAVAASPAEATSGQTTAAAAGSSSQQPREKGRATPAADAPAAGSTGKTRREERADSDDSVVLMEPAKRKKPVVEIIEILDDSDED